MTNNNSKKGKPAIQIWKHWEWKSRSGERAKFCGAFLVVVFFFFLTYDNSFYPPIFFVCYSTVLRNVDSISTSLLSSTPLAHAHSYFSLAMGINPFSCSSPCIKSLTLCVPRSLGSTSLLRLLLSSFQKGAKRAALCFRFYFFQTKRKPGP